MHNDSLRIYGLTGGAGSGKSEAARRFRAKGIPVIDADQLGHRVIAPGGAAEQAVRAAFGPAILTEGAIDRAKLGSIVFAGPEARERLNAIVHPIIYEEMLREARALGAAGHRTVLMDAALLAEDGILPPWMAGLIVVHAGAALRERRLVEGRGLDPESARRRIAAQTPPEQKFALADWVIENEDTLANLYARVDAIAEVIHARSECT